MDEMMKKLLLAAVYILGLSSTTAIAALPPYADSVWQMATIFDSEDVMRTVEGAPITTVDYLGADEEGVRQWRLRTASCTFAIGLQELPMPQNDDGIPMVGRTDYVVASIVRIDELCQQR